MKKTKSIKAKCPECLRKMVLRNRVMHIGIMTKERLVCDTCYNKMPLGLKIGRVK